MNQDQPHSPDNGRPTDTAVSRGGEEHHHTKRMGTEPILRIMLQFAVPAIIGLMLHAFYNIVDRFFVGNYVSVDALSAISISFPILVICFSVGMTISVGSAALISIQLGCKELVKAEKVLSNAFFLLITLFPCLTVIGWLFTDELLRAFGASEHLVPVSRNYLRIILLGVTIDMMAMAGNFIIRASGHPIYSMITLIIGAVANIMLDALFILGFGWGIEGAAIATVIAQVLAVLWAFSYFFRKEAVLRFYLFRIKPSLAVCKQIMAVGMPAGFMEVAFAILVWQMNKAVYPFAGDMGIAAMGVIFTLSMILFLPIFGILEGARPLFGYNYGARNYARVLETLKMAIIAVTTFSFIGVSLFVLVPEYLVQIFTDDQHLIQFTAHGIRIAYLGTLFSSVAIVTSCLYQAMANPLPAAVLSISRNCLFVMLPLLILPAMIGINGIWLSYVVGDVISFAVGLILLRHQYRRLKRLDSEQKQQSFANA